LGAISAGIIAFVGNSLAFPLGTIERHEIILKKKYRKMSHSQSLHDARIDIFLVEFGLYRSTPFIAFPGFSSQDAREIPLDDS
jgi:hypothetical protein